MMQASKYIWWNIFSGLKSNTKSRIFCLIFMLQRLVYPLILIVGSNLWCEAKLGTMTAIQFVIFLYLWLWRPYLTIKDLLLDIITQVLSGVWYAILIYYNTESRWNTIVNWTFVALIMGSSLIATIITIIDFIIIVKNKVKERWSKSRTNFLTCTPPTPFWGWGMFLLKYIQGYSGISRIYFSIFLIKIFPKIYPGYPGSKLVNVLKKFWWFISFVISQKLKFHRIYQIFQ